MKISVEWNGPDQRYLIGTYPSRWTWQDFDNFKAEVDALIGSVPYEVGAIADMSVSTWLPQDASRNFSKAFSTAPRNMGLVVVVTTNRFISIVLNLVRRIVPNSPARNLMFVATPDEAHQLMNDHYPAGKTASDA